MPDREKVIKGLECCYDPNALCSNSDCPYYGRDDEDRHCDVALIQDALALLKAQEPVMPNVIMQGKMVLWYQCPKCLATINSGDKFCNCGRAVKWE